MLISVLTGRPRISHMPRAFVQDYRSRTCYVPGCGHSGAVCLSKKVVLRGPSDEHLRACERWKA